jgi:hypothetical protein
MHQGSSLLLNGADRSIVYTVPIQICHISSSNGDELDIIAPGGCITGKIRTGKDKGAVTDIVTR